MSSLDERLDALEARMDRFETRLVRFALEGNRLAYSAREAADVLGVSVNRVYELAQKGEIPAVRIGGRWLIPVARFEAQRAS